MATAADPNTPQAPLATLVGTARAIFVGLVWGALMLGVFGYWMGSKYENTRPIITYIFKFGALGALGLAIWQAFTLWMKKETPEQKAATLQPQQRIFSYIFIAAGFGLILMAFALGMGTNVGGRYAFKQENFAETFGVLLFGLIAMAGGYALQAPVGPHVSPIQFLMDKVPLMKLGLVVLSALSIIAFVAFFLSNSSQEAHRLVGEMKKGAEAGFTFSLTMYLPEYFSLFCVSIMSICCALWLNTGQVDEFRVRLFVLIFGGALGLILFLETLGRAWIWRNDIFLGGTAAWQGENAWHFWLCAYMLFVSLAVMGASFNLARADIRTNVVLRRVMYGYDAIVQGMLLIGILAILNVVIYALAPFSFDWTQSRGAYALAESSKNLIAKLPQEVNIIVTIPQNQAVYKDVHNLLDNCEAIGPKLKVKYLSADSQPMEFETLLRDFPVIPPEIPGNRGVLIVYGAMPTEKDHTVAHTYLQMQKLFEVKQPRQRGETMQYSFKGETEILKELKFLVDSKKKRKIYVLQGDGEPNIKSENLTDRQDFGGFGALGLDVLVEKLRDDNYDVSGLNFGVEKADKEVKDMVFAKEGADKKKSMPEDCHALIIAGVSKQLKPETLEAIERYVDQRNGKLLVFLDVITDDRMTTLENSGLESMLRRYGVEAPNEFILRVPDRRIPDPRAFYAAAPAKSENALASKFNLKAILMRRSARVVRPAEVPGRYKAETILQVELADSRNFGQNFLVEKDVSALKDPLGYIVGLSRSGQLEAKLSPSPVSVAVTVTDDLKKPRMVVFGDTEFITNLDMLRSPTLRTNYALTLSALEWMAEREDIGARPKEKKEFVLDAGVDFWRMILLPGWLMLVTLIFLGVSIWIVRRR